MRRLVLLAFTIYAVPGFGWGPEGHRLVGRLADGMLTPEAQARVRATLAQTETIAAISTWPDQVRATRKETEPWHFVDIEITSSGLDMNRDCPHNECVLGKITEFRKLWRDETASPAVRREALLFLVHLVGDMHQPLHCADHYDKGGNEVQVEFFGVPTNLHQLWDSGLLRRLPAEDELFLRLSNAITRAERAEWSRGTVEEWAGESFRAAQQVVYGDLPKVPHGVIPELGARYERAADPVVGRQLEKAGVRLAAILNGTP